MSVTATEAKHRFGQLLEPAQRGAAAEEPAPRYRPEAQAFYEKYKDWVDEQQAHFDQYSVFGEAYRQW
ncbi:MAG: hypothetical protein LCI02_25965 [Proteobacteria bacterium]|nr:hypothetical protein [Pseudomonadota bacterium]